MRSSGKGRRWGMGLAVTFTTLAVLGLVLAFPREPLPRPTRPGTPVTAPPDTRAEGVKVQVGDRLPYLVLRDMDGEEVRLWDYAGRLPLVIEFGSFT